VVSALFTDLNNIYEWRAKFIGPKDTPYKNGLFLLKLTFPQDFPKHGPKICFINIIYHFNVNYKNEFGRIYPNFLNQWANSSSPLSNLEHSIRYTLSKIYLIFFNPGIESPIDEELCQEYKNNPELFNEKAIYFTQKYAGIYRTDDNKTEWPLSKNKDNYIPKENISVIFETDGINKITIKCKKNETIKNLIFKYIEESKINIDVHQLLFINSNKTIDYDDKRKITEINIYIDSLISVIKKDLIFA